MEDLDATIHVSGLSELEKDLMAMPAKMARGIVRNNTAKAVDIVHRDAVAKVPAKTGTLKSAIKKSTGYVVNKRAAIGRIYVDAKKAFYGRFIETGTKNMSAKPFMRPAFDENKDKLAKVIMDGIGDDVERALKK